MFLELHPFMFWYLGIINLITFIVFAVDKISSRSHAWRIRERTLLLLAFLGGSAGALLAMQMLRHKTKKNSFLIVLAIIFIVQLVAIFFSDLLLDRLA